MKGRILLIWLFCLVFLFFGAGNLHNAGAAINTATYYNNYSDVRFGNK